MVADSIGILCAPQLSRIMRCFQKTGNQNLKASDICQRLRKLARLGFLKNQRPLARSTPIAEARFVVAERLWRV
jgi:hypothetical protein